MSGDETNVAELSSAHQEALQTYIAVTGQEPTDAIPLLQRSEWNVQVSSSSLHCYEKSQW